MFEQDWFMRQMQLGTQALARFLLNKDAPEQEILFQTENSLSDPLYLQLLGLISQDKVNEAEDLLFFEMDISDIRYIWIAVAFYQKITQFSDSHLKRCLFSRQEIEQGLSDVAALYGLPPELMRLGIV